MTLNRNIQPVLLLLFSFVFQQSVAQTSLNQTQTTLTTTKSTATTRVNSCAALFTRSTAGGAFEYTYNGDSTSNNVSCKWTIASTTSKKGIEIMMDPLNSNYDAFTLLIGNREYPLNYRYLSSFCRLPTIGSYFIPSQVVKLKYTPTDSSSRLPNQQFKISYIFKEDPRCIVIRKSNSSSATMTVTISKNAAMSSSNSCFVPISSNQPSMGTEIVSIDSCNSNTKQTPWSFATSTAFDLCELGIPRFAIGLDDYVHYLEQLSASTSYTIEYRFKQVNEICPTPSVVKNDTITTYTWNSTIPRTQCSFEITVPQKGIEVTIRQQNVYITAETDNSISRWGISIQNNDKQFSIYHINAMMLRFDLITKKTPGTLEITYEQKQVPDKCRAEWTKNGRGGKIVFPAASKFYYPNLDCKWDLSTDQPNTEIEVSFIKLDVYNPGEPWCLFDSVSFLDKNQGTVLDRVCQRSTDWPKTFHTTSLSVAFQSNIGNSGTGFEIVYTFKPT